jgi:hypothetical protein
MEAILIPIVAILSVFGLPVVAILGWIWMKERTKQSAHKLLSEALARGQNIDPAVLTQLAELRSSPADRPRRTLGSAVVMIALAFGFAAASYFSGDWGPGGFDGGLMIPATILGALGVAFLILALVDYSAKKKSDQ